MYACNLHSRNIPTENHSLFLQEAVHTLVLPHEDHVLSVQPNIESTTQTAANADQGKHEQLLRIEREVHGEIRREHRGDRFLPLEPDREQSKHRGAAHCSEESSPIISYGEVNRGYFDAEENSSDWRCETGGDSNGACRSEHLAISALVFVDPLETGDQFGQKGGHDTGDVHEGAFLAQRYTGAQGGGQTYHLLDIRPGGSTPMLENRSFKETGNFIRFGFNSEEGSIYLIINLT